MTSLPPLPAGDARQPDALDAFLDGLAAGQTGSPRDLDPTLTATVRHVHGLANQFVATDLDRAGKAPRWEDLMQRHDRNRIARSTVRPFPMTATLPSSAPPPIPLRPSMPKSRLLRLGGQSLGLVATLTLVLLVAASSMALYLTAPQGADEPTMIPAAMGATPTVESSPVATNPRLPLQPCNVIALTFDDLMAILAANFEDEAPPPDVTLMSVPLPDGAPVDPSITETLTRLTGTYLNCPSFLQLAAMSTDDGIYRMYSSTVIQASPEFNFLDGARIVQAWRQRGGVDTSGLTAAGQPSSFVLGELRRLDDGRIAGYLSGSYSLAADGTLTIGTEGYAVFAEVGGQWRIDDFRPAPLG